MSIGPVLVLGALALALPAQAAADSVTARDQGGVPGKVAERFRLTADERRTLDIASLQVTGQEGVGVSSTFASKATSGACWATAASGAPGSRSCCTPGSRC
jgi:hypothetical protein